MQRDGMDTAFLALCNDGIPPFIAKYATGLYMAAYTKRVDASEGFYEALAALLGTHFNTALQTFGALYIAPENVAPTDLEVLMCQHLCNHGVASARAKYIAVVHADVFSGRIAATYADLFYAMSALAGQDVPNMLSALSRLVPCAHAETQGPRVRVAPSEALGPDHIVHLKCISACELEAWTKTDARKRARLQ